MVRSKSQLFFTISSTQKDAAEYSSGKPNTSLAMKHLLELKLGFI